MTGAASKLVDALERRWLAGYREFAAQHAGSVVDPRELVAKAHAWARPIAIETAFDLQRAVARLVDRDLAEDVMRREQVVDGIPFWWRLGPAERTQRFIEFRRTHQIAQEPSPPDWPGDVTLLEVAEWARERLNRIDGASIAVWKRGGLDLETLKGRVGDQLVACAQRDAWPLSLRWVEPDGIGVELTAYALALLFRAERSAALVTRRPLVLSPVQVDRPAVRSMTALVGAHWESLDSEFGRFADDPNAPTHMEFRWPDGTQLEFNFAPGAGPLVAVAQKYGAAAVRNMLGLYALTWAARAKAGQALWWWPDEHLWLCGLSPSKDNRTALRAWLANMQTAMLEARYSSGRPLRGPLVTLSATDGVACSLHLHPALYREITSDAGAPGGYWWLMPTELLRVPVNQGADRLHVLVPVLGSQWRAAMGARSDEVRTNISVQRLADYLSFRPHQGRAYDPRMAETIEATLEKARDVGFIGRWMIVDGELARLTGRLVATPGEAARRIIGGAKLPKAAWLPATGADLEAWMKRAEISSAEASERVGVPSSTLRRLTQTHRSRPLPPEVRAAFRKALWGEE